MILIVGLGNIGKQYTNNRHNIGFLVIDALVALLQALPQPTKHFDGMLYKSGQILLLKPSTLMNHSGQSVIAVWHFYKPQSVIVIHDDLDLAFGSLRFKFGGGNGGHNGLKSIDKHIGQEYYRVRYGIGRPAQKEQIIPWVLGDFSPQEQEQNLNLIPHCAQATLQISKLNTPQELSEAMLQYTLPKR